MRPNTELVQLYWDIGRIIVRQQEQANWGDAVVEQLGADLRLAFPDMKGLSSFNLWRTRKFYICCRELNGWFQQWRATGPAGARAPSEPGSSAPGERQLRRAILANLRDFFLDHLAERAEVVVQRDRHSDVAVIDHDLTRAVREEPPHDIANGF